MGGDLKNRERYVAKRGRWEGGREEGRKGRVV